MTSLTVSVIVPAYNMSKYLAETLDSLLAQDYKPIEIIVVDDGSLDDTPKIVQSYLHDPRIQYVYQKNSGTAKARNSGIEKSSGSFLMFVDGDDVLPEKSVSRLVNKLLSLDEDYCLVYGCMEYFEDGTNKKLGLAQFEENISRRKLYTLRTNMILASVIRREAIEKVSGFNEKLIYNEDYEMLLRLAKIFKFGSISHMVYRYRVRSNSKTQNGSYKRAVEVTEKRYSYFSDLLRDEDFITRVQAWGSHFLTAGVEFRKFDKRLSQTYFFISFLIYPFNLVSLRLLFASLRGKY